METKVKTNFCEGKNENYYVSWKIYEQEVKKIGDKLKKEKGLTDIIAIKRGGLIGGVILSHYLDLPLRSLHIGEILSSEESKCIEIRGLLWDDISDKGNTFLKAKNSLQKYYSNIVTASVYVVEKTCFIPDYYNRILPENYWAVFPWEK